jgi:hypothetical protein
MPALVTDEAFDDTTEVTFAHVGRPLAFVMSICPAEPAAVVPSEVTEVA